MPAPSSVPFFLLGARSVWLALSHAAIDSSLEGCEIVAGGRSVAKTTGTVANNCRTLKGCQTSETLSGFRTVFNRSGGGVPTRRDLPPATVFHGYAVSFSYAAPSSVPFFLLGARSVWLALSHAAIDGSLEGCEIVAGGRSVAKTTGTVANNCRTLKGCQTSETLSGFRTVFNRSGGGVPTCRDLPPATFFHGYAVSFSYAAPSSVPFFLLGARSVWLALSHAAIDGSLEGCEIVAGGRSVAKTAGTVANNCRTLKGCQTSETLSGFRTVFNRSGGGVPTCRDLPPATFFHGYAVRVALR